MRPRRQRPRPARTLAFAGAVLLAASGCGSDDEASSEASIEDFCAAVNASSEEDDTEIDQTDVDEIRELTEIAPAEIRAALATTADAYEEAVGLGDDPENLDEFFAVMLTDEVVAAGIELEEFGVEQCGFDPADPNDDRIDMSEVYESGVLDDPDLGEASVEGLETFLEEENEPWLDKITGYERTPTGWTVTGTDLAPDGIRVCMWTSSYLVSAAPGESVTVVDVDSTSGETTPVAVSDSEGFCSDA